MCVRFRLISSRKLSGPSLGPMQIGSSKGDRQIWFISKLLFLGRNYGIVSLIYSWNSHRDVNHSGTWWRQPTRSSLLQRRKKNYYFRRNRRAELNDNRRVCSEPTREDKIWKILNNSKSLAEWEGKLLRLSFPRRSLWSVALLCAAKKRKDS